MTRTAVRPSPWDPAVTLADVCDSHGRRSPAAQRAAQRVRHRCRRRGIRRVVRAGRLERLLDKWNSRRPMSQTEMAELMGVSRDTIGEIERRALAKIRAAMQRECAA